MMPWPISRPGRLDAPWLARRDKPPKLRHAMPLSGRSSSPDFGGERWLHAPWQTCNAPSAAHVSKERQAAPRNKRSDAGVARYSARAEARVRDLLACGFACISWLSEPWRVGCSSLATHTISISIQVPAVPRIPDPNRRRARRAGGIAVAVVRRATRCRCAHGLRRTSHRRGRLRWLAVAVVIAGLAVVVAALGVEAAAVRDGDGGRGEEQCAGQVPELHGGPPPRRRGGRYALPGPAA